MKIASAIYKINQNILTVSHPNACFPKADLSWVACISHVTSLTRLFAGVATVFLFSFSFFCCFVTGVL